MRRPLPRAPVGSGALRYPTGFDDRRKLYRGDARENDRAETLGVHTGSMPGRLCLPTRRDCLCSGSSELRPLPWILGDALVAANPPAVGHLPAAIGTHPRRSSVSTRWPLMRTDPVRTGRCCRFAGLSQPGRSDLAASSAASPARTCQPLRLPARALRAERRGRANAPSVGPARRSHA